MKYIFLLFFCFASSNGIVAQTVEKAVTLETSTGVLEGTLLYPESSMEPMVVLIVPGSGPTDRNGNNPMMSNNAYKMIAEGLAENNIASLRIDKRGIGASASAMGKEIDLRFEIYIEDIKAWVTFLNKDTRFNEVVIAGHSEGSLIGMIAAQEKGVAKFISIAGPGEPAGKTLGEQLQAQPDYVKDQAMPILDKLIQGETQDSVPPMLNALFRPSVQPYIISWFKYDPKEEIAKLTCPVLILQGTTDIQVAVRDADNLALGNRNATKVILDGMNHILKNAEADRTKNIATYSDPNLPLHSELLKAMVDFITVK